MRPIEYVHTFPANWWLRKGTYFLFMVRELTSLFVLGYVVFLLVLVALADDPASFSQLFETLQSPWSVTLHLVALAMVIFHAITWINLTPKVLVVWLGEERVPPFMIAGSNFVAWLVTSAVVAWYVLR